MIRKNGPQRVQAHFCHYILCIVPTAREQGPVCEPATQIPHLKVTPHSVSLGEILPKSDRGCESGRL